MASDGSETEALLPTNSSGTQHRPSEKRDRVGFVIIFAAILFLLSWVTIFTGWTSESTIPEPPLPKDPLERARALLDRHPLIDGHIDLPIQTRVRYANRLDEIDLADEDFPMHVNIPKLREGRVGGFFWSAYVPCASDAREDEGTNFTKATWRVRDTLEQIDISKLLIEKFGDTFELTTTANAVRTAFERKKVASLIGLEGAHQLGNSLASLRQFYDLGVRYITLTHTCNNAFAGSCGMDGIPIKDYGLTPFGEKLVQEMNRIGMIVDVSHTSEHTARDVLKLSKAPVIFSHSNAKGVWNVTRNVPDDILEHLRQGKSQEAVVMATFAPQFVSQHENGEGIKATLERVADHIDYLGDKAGREHVGIGSDFDGIGSTPTGLEDVSKYPYLFAELIKRGWSDEELIGLAGGNFLRIMDGVERTAIEMKDIAPGTAIYDKRPDLPWHWSL